MRNNHIQGGDLNNIIQEIKRYSKDALLPFASAQKIADSFDLSIKELESLALENGIFPMRFARNRETIDAFGQLKLLSSKVTIIGCGGLGGHVAVMLARIGIGEMILIDPDIYEETNLNRQRFASLDTIGEHKVSILAKELPLINPALDIHTYVKYLDPESDFGIISGADVVIDALDDPSVKLSLARECTDRNIPFVHGAIAGMSGQVSVNTTLEHIYHEDGKGTEEKMGNLSFSAAFVASIQAAETIKLILGIGETLDGKILITDLLNDDFTLLPA